MKTYTSYLFTLIALLSASCENELPFNIKENPPKLVMNALINADSLTNTLFLNFTGREYATHAKDATVEVRINGQLTESLRPLPSKEEGDIQCHFDMTSKFSPGDIVRIDAITDDGKYHTWAEVIVPKPLEKIEKIDTLTVPFLRYDYTSDYLRYKITFSDLPGEKNYYRLIVDNRIATFELNDKTGEVVAKTMHNYQYIDREDIVLTDGQPSTGEDEDNSLFETVKNRYGIFDDSRFRNTSYTMTVYSLPDRDPDINQPYPEKSEVIVRLLSITETEYYYLKALNLIDSDTYDETINEPIKYPSNVHGGIGIIGISTEVGKIIHIGEWK